LLRALRLLAIILGDNLLHLVDFNVAQLVDGSLEDGELSRTEDVVLFATLPCFLFIDDTVTAFDRANSRLVEVVERTGKAVRLIGDAVVFEERHPVAQSLSWIAIAVANIN